MKLESATHRIPFDVMPPRVEARLRFTRLEIEALKRACDILERADSMCLDHFRRRENDDREMLSLADFGEDDLNRWFFTGDLREMIEQSGRDGLIVDWNHTKTPVREGV